MLAGCLTLRAQLPQLYNFPGTKYSDDKREVTRMFVAFLKTKYPEMPLTKESLGGSVRSFYEDSSNLCKRFSPGEMLWMLTAGGTVSVKDDDLTWRDGRVAQIAGFASK